MTKKEFLESGLVEQYILGLTDEHESELVEKFAREDPAIRRMIRQTRKELSTAMERSGVPPRDLKEPDVPESTPPIGKLDYFRILTSLLVLALAIALWVVYGNYRQALSENHRLASELAVLRSVCSEKNQQVYDARQLQAVLDHGATCKRPVFSEDPDNQVAGLMFWNDEAGKAFFQALELPDPGPEHQYQLWAKVNGEMVNMGLLKDLSSRIVEYRYVEDAIGWNLTMEPEGGAESPDIDRIVASGSLLQ